MRVVCNTNLWLLNKQVCGPHLELSEINRLESIQRNFTTKLHVLCDLPYDEKLAKCELVTLELRRLRMDLGLCYQIVNGFIALNFVDFFTADTNRRTRGNRQKLKIPKLSHCLLEHIFSQWELLRCGTLSPTTLYCADHINDFVNWLKLLTLPSSWKGNVITQ